MATELENGALFAAMNLLVHSVMYSYFSSVAFGKRWGTGVRLFITSLQIIQMLFGVVIIVYNMVHCNTHPYLSAAGLLMYISYAYLFIELFIKNYIVKQPHANKASD